MSADVRYFWRETQVYSVQYMDNKEFADRFPDVHGIRIDGFQKLVARAPGRMDEIVPVTRRVFFKRNPSLHKCDGRCLNAKGLSCECSCGGKNHGRGNAE